MLFGLYLLEYQHAGYVIPSEMYWSQSVQELDSAIQRINHYPVDKYKENQLRYPLDRDLSAG